MKNFEKLFLGLVFGAAFPFLFSLVAMFLWFYISKNEAYALYVLLSGLSVGIVTDIFFLKKWVVRRYELSMGFISAIYLLYNIGIYGMFMGFPVFNCLMGLPAGYYFGKRIAHNEVSIENQSVLINRVSLFTAMIMMVICGSTALLVLTDKTIALSLQQMLGLHFEVTRSMIIGVIILGGAFLITIQFFITKLTIKQTLKAELLL